MNKNRYVLCLLLCGWLIYFAIPRISLVAGGEAGVFATTWLVFALFVLAGNLSAILYSPKKRKQQSHPVSSKRKIRSYNG